jgi:hypothetical protein
VYIDVVEQRHYAPDQEQVGWNPLSVQALQYPPEYAMTLQVLMKNHTIEDRTVVRISKGIAARTTIVLLIVLLRWLYMIHRYVLGLREVLSAE